MDFDQTCTTILLWHGKELFRFWWPWVYFQGHRRAQIVGKWFVCPLSPEWMDIFWPILYSYIVETGTRTDCILVTLTSFSRSQCSDCWKRACLHPISRMNWWFLTKLVILYCCDMEQNWLDFDYHDPIFKVTQRLRLLKNGLSAP